MPQPSRPRNGSVVRSPRELPRLPVTTALSLFVALAAVVLIAYSTYRSLNARAVSIERLRSSARAAELVDQAYATLLEAHGGQRSYLLLGDEEYLSAFAIARAELPQMLDNLREAVKDDPEQLARTDALAEAIGERLTLMEETIDEHRSGDVEGAKALVQSGRGRSLNQRVGDLTQDLRQASQLRVEQRHGEWLSAVRASSFVSWAGSALLLSLIAAAGFMMSREFRERERQTWLRVGAAAFGDRVLGERDLGKLGETVLAFLVDWLDVQVGAVYLVEPESGRLRRFAGWAVAPGTPELVSAGEGLLGEALRADRTLHVRDVPPGHLPVSSALGRSSPRELVIVSATADGEVVAALELGFLRALLPTEIALVEAIAESFGVAVRSARDREALGDLLEETREQAAELEARQEELRVSNDELEEHGRALEESQTRLEEQQSELEQSNAQLEEQASLLEAQKEAIERAHRSLAERARELERADRYKSEFLANMSHELRTPLNSSLILAKLLAENKQGNLDAEQVEFANTIHASGNELLALINDVLDLARIEAGKVDIEIERLSLSATVESLIKAHEPVAREKHLQLDLDVRPDAPDSIETDGRRLGQILRNLLSNALKFTERGRVVLTVGQAHDGGVEFTVSDTGIGIEEDHLDTIFEAFRQADGSTHRRYGGTGLGLTISRDLAHVLGGSISVRSVPGEGSSFTLALPATATVRNGSQPRQNGHNGRNGARRQPAADGQRREVPPAPVLPAPAAIEDDRAQAATSKRVLLVIEDDVRFARVLRDLGREKGFACVVTHTAQDGLRAAFECSPSAIVLDVRLPDHARLGVLDQLKRDSRTRHVPVHVVSAVDHAQEALELGAIGYAVKPIDLDELREVFARLERTLAAWQRRVLVADPDPARRKAVRELLEQDGVEIAEAVDAHQALSLLRTTSFDCVVMDLDLPQDRAHWLLEQMSELESVPFPPVIVHARRPVREDEAQRLRLLAAPLIVKSARTPERLLDEVTLFLHQVESSLPPQRQRMLRAARDRQSDLAGRRILVVEDDVRNVFALTRVLEPRGAEVCVARNGREALAVLDSSMANPETAVDVVLMDIMMPEMDGLTATRAIRARSDWARLPVIALTAKAMPDDRDACLAAGANDYIAKPLDVERLLSLVRVWLPKAVAT